MKKYQYVSLFIVVMLVFVSGLTAVRAENEDSASVEIKTELRTPVRPVDKIMTPAQKAEREKKQKELKNNMEMQKMEIEGRKIESKEKMEIQKIELKDKKTELKEAREVKKEELKTNVEAKKIEIKENREVKKQEFEERKTEMKGNVEEIRSKARALAGDALLRRAENLSQISARIKSRIEKIKATGVDTGDSLDLVTKANVSIAIGKSNAEKVKAGSANSDTIETVKANVEASKKALKNAHEYLKEAVIELRNKLPVKTEVKTEIKTEASTSTNAPAPTQ